MKRFLVALVIVFLGFSLISFVISKNDESKHLSKASRISGNEKSPSPNPLQDSGTDSTTNSLNSKSPQSVSKVADTTQQEKTNSETTNNQSDEEVSAASVLDSLRQDLSESSFTCAVINPLQIQLIPVIGTTSSDTLAACQYQNPGQNGFALYVLTSAEAIDKYGNDRSYNQYLNFQTPLSGKMESTFFTPSQKAIIFVTGGQLAFQANEIAWGTLDALNFNPPKKG